MTVQVSRSDPRFWLIGLLGVIAGIGVFAFVTGTAWATGKLGNLRLRLVVAGFLVIVTAVVAAMSNYWPQTVWTSEDNLWGLVAPTVAAALASSIAGNFRGGGAGGGGGGAGANTGGSAAMTGGPWARVLRR